MKILYAEDEKNMSDAIVDILTYHNYNVDAVYNGQDALDYAKLENYDGIILDIMMPKLNGFEVLKQLRETGCKTPVMLLTAKSETEDMVQGLNAGADDYITKPFVPAEVLARVRSHLRRYETLGSRVQKAEDELALGSIVLNDRTKTVFVDGQSVALTPTEYSILRLLMRHPGQVYSTKALYEAVWQEAPFGSEGAVAVHIRHLREKIEINPSEPRYLKVVWGQGYKMEGKE